MLPRAIAYSSVVLTGFVVGCGQTSTTIIEPVSKPASSGIDTANDRSASKAETTAEVVPASDVELIEASWEELQTLIAEQKGKVVVVDLWSTSCEPCMIEFPHLIALQNRFPDDVAAISFDLDYAGMKKRPVSFYRERVLKFLESQSKSTALHRMSNVPADDKFYAEIKLDSIPAIYVYQRDGKLAKRFDGSNSQGEGVSYEKQVVPFVEELLKVKD